MATIESWHPVERIIRLLHDAGLEAYFGEPVTQLEHALQTAALAEAAAASDALIVAALLHDIGHLVNADTSVEAGADVEGKHEDVGHVWLSPYFDRDVTEPIRLHVAAKRYLCAIDPGYRASLSRMSRSTLAQQGGPMRAAEVAAFRELPWSKEAAALRRWDDAAKEPGRKVPGVLHYQPRLLKLSRRA